MLLSDLIDGDLIKLEIESTKKEDIIKEMVELFEKKGVIGDKRKVIDAVMQREQIESTAIGEGIAIPHCRSSEVKELKVALGISRKGVDFEALDGKPVYVIFMILAPEKARKEYIQTVAKIARLLKSKIMREALKKATSEDDIIKVIADFDGIAPEEVKVKMKKGRVIYKQEE